MNKKVPTKNCGIPLINPYNFSRPVKHLEELGGRETEVENIRNSLVGKQVSIALIGKRGIGKTSLLNATGELCKQLNYLPVHISLDEQLVSDDFLFFKELYSNLIQTLHNLKKITDDEHTGFYQMVDNLNQLDGPYFLKFPKAYVNHFKNETANVTRHYIHDDLAILSERAGTQIVFLLDECDHLTTNKAILQILRIFLQKVDGYTLVLAGTSEFLGELNEVFESVVREIKKIDIEGFKDERHTIDFIYKSLPEKDQEKLRFNRELFRDLHQIAEGNPYELKLVCHYLWHYAKRTNEIIFELSPLVLQEVANQMKTAVSEHYKFILDTDYLTSKDVLNVVKFVNNSSLTIHEKAVMEYLFEKECSDEKITQYEDNLRLQANNYEKLLEINDKDKVVFKGGAFEMKVNSEPLEFDKSTAVYFGVGDPEKDSDGNQFFNDNFETAYKYFTTNKTSFKSYSRQEMNEFDDFLDVFFKFKGKPSFRLISINIDTPELKLSGNITLENETQQELLKNFKEEFNQQLEEHKISFSERIYNAPVCDTKDIFSKLNELKIKNDDDNCRILNDHISRAGTRAVTKYKDYQLGNDIFEELCSVLGDSFSFRNNLGFINMHLSLEKAEEELRKAKARLDKGVKADHFVYNYNCASLSIYSNDFGAARNYLKEVNTISEITEKEDGRNEHYLHVFFVGRNSKILRSFHQDNYKIATLLMKAYLDYNEAPQKVNIIENQLKKVYEEHKFDPIYLEGLCNFYKEIGNDEEYEKYQKEKDFVS